MQIRLGVIYVHFGFEYEIYVDSSRVGQVLACRIAIASPPLSISKREPNRTTHHVWQAKLQVVRMFFFMLLSLLRPRRIENDRNPMTVNFV